MNLTAQNDVPLSRVWEIYQIMKQHIASRVFGRETDWNAEIYGDAGFSTIQLILTAILSGGHVLLQDYPGSGKTYLAKQLADCIIADELGQAISCEEYHRIQCVPDLLTTDITGYNSFERVGGETIFRPGPIFACFLLVDEINRTTPKVQSALLEAMAERQVTVEKRTYVLSGAFFVIATQNPLDKIGTFQLPSASLDRFLFKRTMEPISDEDNIRVILGVHNDQRLDEWRKRGKGRKIIQKQENIYPFRKIKITELIAAKKSVSERVRLTLPTIEKLLCLADQVGKACLKPQFGTDIQFVEGSQISSRTLKMLAETLKVVALIRRGEAWEQSGLNPQQVAERLDEGTLETNPGQMREIVADVLRHRVFPKTPVNDKSLEEYLVQLADEAAYERP